MALDLSLPLTDLTGELPPAPPMAARTGVWSIRPDQALRWSTISEPAPTSEAVEQAPFSPARALLVVALVATAGLLGAVGAWALVP